MSENAPLPYAGITRIRFEGSSARQTLSSVYSPRAFNIFVLLLTKSNRGV
jgi:hypothetical protein